MELSPAFEVTTWFAQLESATTLSEFLIVLCSWQLLFCSTSTYPWTQEEQLAELLLLQEAQGKLQRVQVEFELRKESEQQPRHSDGFDCEQEAQKLVLVQGEQTPPERQWPLEHWVQMLGLELEQVRQPGSQMAGALVVGLTVKRVQPEEEWRVVQREAEEQAWQQAWQPQQRFVVVSKKYPSEHEEHTEGSVWLQVRQGESGHRRHEPLDRQQQLRHEVQAEGLVQVEQPDPQLQAQPPPDSRYPASQLVQLPVLVLLQFRQWGSKQKKQLAPWVRLTWLYGRTQVRQLPLEQQVWQGLRQDMHWSEGPVLKESRLQPSWHEPQMFQEEHERQLSTWQLRHTPFCSCKSPLHSPQTQSAEQLVQLLTVLQVTQEEPSVEGEQPGDIVIFTKPRFRTLAPAQLWQTFSWVLEHARQFVMLHLSTHTEFSSTQLLEHSAQPEPPGHTTQFSTEQFSRHVLLEARAKLGSQAEQTLG